MKLLTSETFNFTYEAFNKLLKAEEYTSRLALHIKYALTGNPSWYYYRQIVSMGGSRSSKSYSILQILLIQLLVRHNIKITVWRNTKVTCRATVMEDFKKIIMFDDKVYKNIKENKQSGTFTYKPTKSKIVFEGADNIGKVLGSEQTISFFNEITEFNKEVYLQITQRTSDRVFCDYNPSKDFWLESYRKDPDTKFIHSTFMNNAFCPANIVKQLLSYEPWESGSYKITDGELFYKEKIISSTNTPPPNIKNVERGTANQYMWMVYGLGIGAEKPNRIYNNWIEISEDIYDGLKYKEYFGFDFGTSRPTACLGVKYDGNGAFYIIERMYKPLSNIDDSLPSEIKLNIKAIDKATSLLICDSAKETYINMLLNSGYIALKATKGGGSVSYGISVCQTFKIYYVKSINLNFEYNTYSWIVDRYNKPTEAPVKKDDHLMDCFRYVVTYLIDYLGIKI